MGINPLTSSLRVLGLRDRHQGRANHAIVEAVAFLKHVDYGVWLLLRWEHANRLVPVRVEFLPGGADFLETRLPEHRAQLLQRQLDPVPQRFQGRGVGGEGRFQAVLDGQQLDGDRLDRVLVGVGQLERCSLADVVRFGLSSKPGIVVLLRLRLGLPQQLAQVRR